MQTISQLLHTRGLTSFTLLLVSAFPQQSRQLQLMRWRRCSRFVRSVWKIEVPLGGSSPHLVASNKESKMLKDMMRRAWVYLQLYRLEVVVWKKEK